MNEVTITIHAGKADRLTPGEREAHFFFFFRRPHENPALSPMSVSVKGDLVER